MANVALHDGGGNAARGGDVGYSKNERSDNNMQSRMRDFSIRANKEIAENELDYKLLDIERKRRHSLVLWHQNVMALHQELWQMSEELQDSLVRDERDDRPDQIKKSLQNIKPIEEMSEEEINRLPILMRPRPKYPPDKLMFMTKRQLRDINDHNYEATMDRLRGGGEHSEFIRLVHSDTVVAAGARPTPPTQQQGSVDGGSARHPAAGRPNPAGVPINSPQSQRFPSLRTPQHYGILLQPERQTRLELRGALQRAKTMPSGGLKSSDRRHKENVSVVFEESICSEVPVMSDNRAKPSSSRTSFRQHAVTPKPTPKPTASARSPVKRESPSCTLGVKSRSVPDMKMETEDALTKKPPSAEVISPVPTNINGSKKHSARGKSPVNELTEDRALQSSKSPKPKKKQKFRVPDKLDDLTDKAFRRKLFKHYNKTREDRNAQNSMESSLGEKKTFLRIKMADIVNTSERHHSQNRILKRLVERSTLAKEDTEENTDTETDANNTGHGLPHIDNGNVQQKTKATSHPTAHGQDKRLNLPSLRNNHPVSQRRPAEPRPKPAVLSTSIRTVGPFNQNNNNHDGDCDLQESSMENWLELQSPKSIETSRTASGVPVLAVISEDELEIIDVEREPAVVIEQVVETMRIKSFSHIESSKHKNLLLRKSSFDRNTPRDEPETPNMPTVEELQDHEELEEDPDGQGDVFDGDVKDCKYLRGYDPLTSRPIENVEEFFTSIDDDEPKLKNVAFFHPAQFQGIVTQPGRVGFECN